MINTIAHHLPAPTPKYKLFQGVKDALQAIKNNLRTVLGSMFVAILLVVVVVVVTTLLFGTAILIEMGSAFSPTVTGSGLILSLLAIIIAGSFISALINIFMALSVSDGADGRKTSMIDVFVRSRKLLWRVLKVSVIVFFVMLAPFLLIGMFSLLSLVGKYGNGADPTMSILFLLLGLASAVWMIIAALRYSLAPLVAIFEPTVPTARTLKRSRHLLMEGGQWFILKAIGAMLLVSILVSIPAGGQNANGFGGVGSAIGDVINYLIGLVFTGVLVMLYRNRSAVRG